MLDADQVRMVCELYVCLTPQFETAWLGLLRALHVNVRQGSTVHDQPLA